ncbi:MAG: hypothetical protein GX862_06720 [Leucobacter sp.]|nr:hypothetical protein [Leucobacter sp.]
MRNAVQIHKSRETGASNIVAANVRAQLAYAGLPQGALAEILGLSKMAGSRRLNNETEFTAGEIALVADYFDIEPGDLFKGSSPRKPSNHRTLVP